MEVSKKVLEKLFLAKILKFQKIFFFNFSKKSFPKKIFFFNFFCVVNENHFTNALHTKRLFLKCFQHRSKINLFFIILCLFVEIPKNHDFSQKILIFTYDPKKYKLWVKVCEFAPKIVLICFKNVSNTCFWDLLQKHFKIGQIFVIFGKIGKNTIF